MQVQKITTCLWFQTQAAEPAKFYVSLFDDAKVVSESPVVTMFQLAGQQFMALNGNREQPFTDAVSLMVTCKDQREVDTLWDALLAKGGKATMCGWLKDRFGVSWQIVPSRLQALLNDPDPAKARRTAEAMMKMVKLDVAALERAHAGK